MKKTAMDCVKLARDPKRPHLRDFIGLMCGDFTELHGDRLVNDDRGLIGGFATIDGEKVLILGHNKGATVEENMAANFGMANPDGYRKAMRLAKLAEKFHVPVVTFVDTPGAYPGREAEERGQAEAIAKSLEFFARLRTPVVVVITGEGGSGGAIAIAVADKVLMLENSIYSVISPEGCASILWRSAEKTKEATEALHLTAQDLKKLGIIDEIVNEPIGGSHRDPTQTIENLRLALKQNLQELNMISYDKLKKQRTAKFMKIGSQFVQAVKLK